MTGFSNFAKIFGAEDKLFGKQAKNEKWVCLVR